MAKKKKTAEADWMNWVQFLAGLWLIASPWVLGYADVSDPMANEVIMGIIVSGLALAQCAIRRK